MKCTLDGTNAKTLARAIQSLSKIGTHLFVEGLQNELQFRTVNLSKSAVAAIKFNRTFFENYSTSGEDSYCKVSMKTCLAVFRNMKHVEQCEIQILPDEEKMLIQFKSFKLETVKDTYIAILDEENISAVNAVDTENSISGSNKMFTELLGNFNLSEEEMTFEVKKDSLTVKNYIEGSRVYDKFMRSQLRLSTVEFENYRIGNETIITFALKEFRALLLFAESLNETLTLNFDDSGSPIYVTIGKADEIDCLLVMSTLSYDDVSFYESCQRSDEVDVLPANSTPPPASKRKIESNSKNTTKNTRKSKVKKVQRYGTPDSTQSLGSVTFPFDSERSTVMTESNSDIPMARDNIAAAFVLSDGSSSQMALPHGNGNVPSVSNLREQHVGAAAAAAFENTGDMEIDAIVPQSPTRDESWHDVRTIFSRCFQNTYIPEQPKPGSDLYVQNSDTED